MKKYFTLFLLMVASALLLPVSVHADSKTFYSKATATAVTSAAGKVYVSNKKDTKGSSASATNNSSTTSSSATHTYCFTAELNDGYVFAGWHTEKTNGSKKSDELQYNEDVVTSSEKSGSPKTIDRYARFTAISVSAASKQSASFNHPETQTVTLSFPVTSGADAKADFNAPTITANTGWSISSWSVDKTNSKVNVVCSFTANSDVAKGTYEATVTLKSKANKSNTGTVSASVDLTPTLTYKNGNVDISVSDADKTILDLNTLRTAYQGADGVAGNGTITYALKTADSNVSLTSAGVFYAKAEGTYTVVASAAKNRYYAKTAEFVVTVGKRTPTVEWKEYDHIYSGNTLTDVTTIKYADKTVTGVGIELTSKNISVMTVEGNNLNAQIIATQQDVQIEAKTVETTYYKSVTVTNTYTVEAKQTPVFKLNGKVLVAADTTIYLKIGETADMAFEKTDETQFSYPTTSGQATYAHNSTTHTGVITANYYGNRTIVFEQTGTTTIFGHKRTITIYVQKHPVTLATTTALNNKTWLVDDVFEGDIYTVNAPASGQPAQNEITVTSSNTGVLKQVDGNWKAVGEGDATLTIAQENNDFWTGDTITKDIHVSKHTPVITWSNDITATLYWASIINNPVTSTNTDIPFTVTSSNTNVADYVNGKLEVYNVNANSVTLTLAQEGNNKWNAAASNLTKTFKVAKPANHVPFELSSSNKSNFQKSATSYASWNSNGYRMCDGGISEREDYVILQFTGVPDELTFDKSLEKKTVLFVSELPGTHLCEVYESSDNSTWESAWLHNERVESTPNQSVKLKPSTQYLKFRYYGTVYANYKNIKVTERKEIVAPEECDFSSGGIGDNPTPRTFKIAWYNVKTCTVTLSGSDAKYFKIGEGSETIDSHLDAFNEEEEITVKYLHEEIANHTATLTITSADGKTASVTLKGETTKATQEIIWNADLIVDGKLLIAKNAVYEDIATASSGLPVELYTADDDNKLTVIDGEKIKGLADGTTKLYAHQAGNDNKWAEVTDNIDVQITSKAVQSIEWNDPLSNIQYTSGTKTLTLTARSSADKELPITYELDNDAKAFASVSDNKLTITGNGTGKITAKQDGNSTYVAVSASRTLTSYNPNENCSSNIISGLPSSVTVKVTSSVTTQEFGLNNEEPSTLSFTADIGSGSLTVAQFYGGTWHSLETFTGSGGDGNHSYPLDRTATKISFQSTIVIAWPTDHKITNMQVTKARYLEEAENNYIDFSSVQLGQTVKRQFTMNYNDASGVFEVKLEKPSEQLELLTKTLGTGCGSSAKDAIVKINCTGKTKGVENNAVIISNNTDSKRIPLEAVVTGLTQQIHWNFDDSEDIQTTDNIQLSATADSELPVVFSSGNESVARIKKVGEDYYLDIIKDGEVTITATQAGDATWESTNKSCVFTISKVTPAITKLPTVNEIILPKKLQDCSFNDDAVTSVAGSFEWQTPTTDIERNNTGYTAIFKPTNGKWYNTTTCTVVVPVAKDPQSITWTITGETNDYIEIYCNASLTFDAYASSGLKVRYSSSDDQIANVDDNGNLRISRGGEVTITAVQEGNETYAAASPRVKTIKILRVSPTIIELPAAVPMKIGRNLSDATLSGGLVELGGQQVYGKFSWVDGNTTPMNVAGTFTKQIVFTPTEAGWYEPQYDELEVVVEKYAPVIEYTLTAETITYGTVLTGTNGLSGTVVATDTVKKPNVTVDGTYAWAAKDDLYGVSTSTATVVFKPLNNLWYNDVEFEVPITVNPAAITYTATATIERGQRLADALFYNSTKGISNEDVEGTIAWAVNVDKTSMPTENGTYDIYVTAAEGSNYQSGNGTCVLTVIPGIVFEGNAATNATDWGNSANWAGADNLPGENDRVVINANVEVTGDVTIGGITINADKTITIKDGGTLTIGAENSLFRSTYGNIIVEAGGQLILGAGNVEVNDFTLYSGFDGNRKPKSGQVTGAAKLNKHGHAYFIIDLDPAGNASAGWYDFTVPFPVNALTGITRSADGETWNTIVNERNYAIMDFHEDLRAQGQYAWKKYRGILQPGVAYTMTIDSRINKYRFEMAANGAFNTATTQALQSTNSSEDAGWNGVGNGTMSYITLRETPVVQMYNHAENAYNATSSASQAFAVGAAYFVQRSDVLSELTMDAAYNATSILRAPQREQEEYSEPLTLTLSQNGLTRDNLFVTCSENATDTYTRGFDVQKLGELTAAKVARLWTNTKGKDLCAVYAPYNANEAIIPLQFFAPEQGEYTLSIDRNTEEDIYLTRNGVIIWDMNMSDYNFTLEQGTDNSYALQVIRRTQNVATGAEQLNNDAQCGTDFVEKMIVNGQLFILRDGNLYDAQGKKVTAIQ